MYYIITTQLRYTLLPKLLSGELNIENVEKEMEGRGQPGPT